MSFWLILLVFSPALLLWGALELFAVLRRNPARRRGRGARFLVTTSRAPQSRWEQIHRGQVSRFDAETIERVRNGLR